jgi:hypothetical protein
MKEKIRRRPAIRVVLRVLYYIPTSFFFVLSSPGPKPLISSFSGILNIMLGEAAMNKLSPTA